MLTLEQFVADPRFAQLDAAGQKTAIDEFFGSEGTDKTAGEAIDGPGLLKSAIDIGDRFENETEFRKPFVAQEFEALKNFRESVRGFRDTSNSRLLDRFDQGLTPESEAGQLILGEENALFKKNTKGAADEFVAKQFRIRDSMVAEKSFQDRVSETARSFLNTDPRSLEDQRERDNGDGFREVINDVVEEFGNLQELKNEQFLAQEQRKSLAGRFERALDISATEALDMADQAIAAEDQVRAAQGEGGFYTDRLGEIGIAPVDLARLSTEEINEQLDALDVPRSAKDRFRANLSLFRKGAASQLADEIRTSIAGQGVDLGFEDDAKDLGEFFTGVRPNSGKRTRFQKAEEEALRKGFEDPDNIRKVLRDMEERGSTLAAGNRNIDKNIVSMVGGAGSLILSALGEDEAAKDFSKGAQFVVQAKTKANELSRLSGAQEFGADLLGTIPDLVVAFAGGAGARGVNALFGTTGKTATRISLAGVSSASGMSAGLKTYNEALSKGFSNSDSLTLGMQSFLITGAVTAAGGLKSGTEGILTGHALVGLKKDFKTYLGTILKGATNEAIEEMADSVISSLTVQQELNPDLTLDQHVEGALHAAALGATLGGGLPAVAGATDVEFNKERNRKNDLRRRFVEDPTSLSDEEIQSLRDEAVEGLMDETRGDEARKALAEQQNRDRLKDGEPVESVEENPSVPEGSARLEEPTEESQPENQNNGEEQKEEIRQEDGDRDQTDQSPDSRADSGTEVRPEVTAKDLERAERIADEKSFSTSPIVRDAVRDGVIDELIKNPKASDAVLRRAGKQAANKASRTQKSQEGQERDGNVGRLVDDEGGDIDLEGRGRNAAQEAEAAEEVDEVGRVIDTLPDGQRQTLNLVAEGFTNVEIAERLGISENAVAKRLEKGRATLKKRLAETPSEPVENTSENPQGSNRQVFDTAVEALRNDANPAVQELAGRIELVEQPSEALTAAAKLGEFFGRRVLAVRGIDQNGVFTPATPDTIFINENADRAEFQVIAHEALHSFRITNPESYENLVAAVEADLDAYVQALPSRSRSDKAEVKEEFLADFFADRLVDQKFLTRLANEDPVNFNKFATFVRNILNKLRTFFKQTKDLDTAKFVSDIDRAEQALIDTLVDVKTGRTPTTTTNDQQTETSPAVPSSRSPETSGSAEAGADTSGASQGGRGADSGEAGSLPGTPQDSPSPGRLDAPSNDAEKGLDSDEEGTQQAGSGRSSEESPSDAAPRPGLEFEPDPNYHQIQGAANIFAPKEQADLEAAKEVISSVFDSEGISLDLAGEQAARTFIANLSDPKFVRGLIARVKAETINTDAQARAVVSAASESAFFNFAARYASSNKEAGARLIYDGFRLRRDIYQEGTTGGNLEAEAYERALFLRALQAFPGGRIVGLFRTEIDSRLDHVRETMGTDVADLTDQTSKVDLSDPEIRAVVDEIVARELATEREQIQKAEQQVRKAWRVVANLIKGEPLDSGTRLENPTEDPFEAFEKLAFDDNADVADIAAAFETLAPQLETRIGKKQAKKVRKAVQQATVDRLGASIIRRANALGDTTPKKTDPVVKEFQDFVATRPDRDAFVAKYVELGGDKARADDVFDAQQKLDQAADTKAEETAESREARKAERDAERAKKRAEKDFAAAQKLVDGVGEPAAKKGDTGSKAPSFKSLIAEFTNLDRAEQTQAQLEAALAALENAEGKPLLTASQVEQASTRAVLARQSAKDARAAQLEAKDAAARAKDAEKFAEQVRKDAEATDAKRVKDALKAQEAAKKKAEDQQKKVDQLVNKMRGTLKPVAKQPRVSITKIVNDFTSLSKPKQDSADLESQLRNVFDKEGNRALTDAQITELVDTAVQTRANAERARAAKKKAEDAAAEVIRAEKLFDPATKKQPTETRSVNKIIMEEFIKNPNRKISTRDERIAFAEEILAEKTNLPPDTISRIAAELESKLADMLFAKKARVAEQILNTVNKGKGLTQEQIHNAIRLEIFDPRNDFTTSVAAMNDWDGLSQSQTAALLESQRRIDLATASRVVAKEYQKMARIIFAASGKSPAFSEFASSWFKGAIFSAVSTQTTGILAGKSALAVQALTESAASLSALTDGGGVGGVVSDLGNVWGNWLTSFQDLVRESLQSAQDGSTFAEQLNVEQERSGREKNKGVDANVHVDALTKVKDLLENKLARDLATFKANKSLKNALKLSKQLIRLGTLMRGTFRALGAVDSAVSKAYTRTQTNILAFRENRKLLAQGEGGLTEAEFRELVDAAHVEADAFTQSLADQGVFDDGGKLGSAKAANLARIVYRDRVQQQVFGGLVRAGVRPEIPGETLKDIQAKIGTGQFDRTAIAALGSLITELGTKAQKIPVLGGLTGGVLLALRTPAVVADFLAWGMPGINIKRTYDLIQLRRKDPERAAELFPSISADWVARRRIAMAVASYPLTVLLAALLAESADEKDEDKTVWFTGDFPDDPQERKNWAKNKWQENMLILGPLRLRIDKGVSQELFGAALIAKAITNANTRDKEEVPLAESYAKDAKAAALALTPSLDQVFELGSKVKRRSTSTVDAAGGFVEEVGFRAVPFSGLLKTIKRSTPGKVDGRNSFADLLVNNPFYVIPDGEGVLHMENAMGERLDQSTGVGDTLRRLGVPIFWTVKEEGRDPDNKRILETFADKDYVGGQLSLPALKRRFEQSGIPYTSENIATYKDKYITTFKGSYLPNEKAFEGLQKDDFKSRMKTLWSRSRKVADQSLGLSPATK